MEKSTNENDVGNIEYYIPAEDETLIKLGYLIAVNEETFNNYTPEVKIIEDE